MFFDSHCHIDFQVFDHNRPQIFANCQQLQLSHLFVPGVSEKGWHRQLALQADHTLDIQLEQGFGLHPYYIAEHGPDALRRLELLLAKHSVAAVGEIGLDFMLDTDSVDKQYELLQQQLSIAKSARLPVVLHIRKAHDQVLKLLKQLKFSEGGIVHAFSGSEQQANRFIEFGFKLGFGGAVTYSRATKLRKLVANLPLNNIVLETDAPDMRPSFEADNYNSPENLPKIAEIIADLRQINIDTLAVQTTLNAKQIFRIK